MRWPLPPTYPLQRSALSHAAHRGHLVQQEERKPDGAMPWQKEPVIVEVTDAPRCSAIDEAVPDGETILEESGAQSPSDQRRRCVGQQAAQRSPEAILHHQQLVPTNAPDARDKG